MKGRIYCIINWIDDLMYIGSTTKTLSKRMKGHIVHARRYRGTRRKLYLHMKMLGQDQFAILLVEELEVASRSELLRREGYYTRLFQAKLNYAIAGRTKSEYRQETKHQKAQTDRKYRLANAERFKIKNRKYYNDNKAAFRQKAIEWRIKNKLAERIKKQKFYKLNKDAINRKRKAHVFCQCGGRYSYNNKDKHISTKMHIRWLASPNKF